ncbi:MAG: hypothetical protein QG608_3662 [Actinomycetota bacterium]|nr:hypothetical protein [Actinomycetota bacterium]
MGLFPRRPDTGVRRTRPRTAPGWEPAPPARRSRQVKAPPNRPHAQDRQTSRLGAVACPLEASAPEATTRRGVWPGATGFPESWRASGGPWNAVGEPVTSVRTSGHVRPRRRDVCRCARPVCAEGPVDSGLEHCGRSCRSQGWCTIFASVVRLFALGGPCPFWWDCSSGCCAEDGPGPHSSCSGAVPDRFVLVVRRWSGVVAAVGPVSRQAEGISFLRRRTGCPCRY